MKVLLIDSNYPINVRNTKLLNSIKEYNNCEVYVASWNRKNLKESNIRTEFDGLYLYNKPRILGKKIEKLLKIRGFYKFLKETNKIEDFDAIIASHYDMLFLSFLLKKKNQILIYENLDIPTHSSKLITLFLSALERISLSKTNSIIHASRFYKSLYGHFNRDQFVIENKPKFKDLNRNIKSTNNDKELNISFIGGVRYVNILFNLIKAAESLQNIKIYIHGEGHQSKELNDFIEAKVRKNLVYVTGRYEYEEIPELYYNSDVIWSVYPNMDKNVRYAISNKFHESLYFIKPGIYSENTKLSELVVNEDIGFEVNPYNVNKIRDLLTKIQKNKVSILEEKRKNILIYYKKNKNNWDDDFLEFNRWLITATSNRV